MTNNQLTDPKAPVTNEELDQMIWKLERDGGMTPKLLSLMRELREVRRANAEKLNQPVSETERTHPNSFTDAELEMMARGDNPQANAYRELLEFRRNSPATPDGWVMVPIDPTESMVIAGFESEPDEFFSEEEDWAAYEAMSGCQQAAHRAKLCYAAMLAAVPKEVK